MIDLKELLTGAVVLGPMTKGCNLPYRRLCAEFGATITMGEMAVARQLKRRSKGEYALIRRAPDESVFGVQLAGSDPEEMGWAAALAEERGADLVDVNLGCPIHDMTRRGLGAALLRRPERIRVIVAAMVAAVKNVPITVKIRLGWSEDDRNFQETAKAAVDGGAAAVFLHGRTRNARYRHAADWDAIGELAATLSVPVVGNGDILDAEDIATFRARSGCAGVMIARGALIKPWIFREAREGPRDLSAEERVDVYRRYVTLAREHWCAGWKAETCIREFVQWHLEFWQRYVPTLPGRPAPKMQVRDAGFEPRSPLEALLARADTAAITYLAERLATGEPIVPHDAPEPDSQNSRPPSGESSWES